MINSELVEMADDAIRKCLNVQLASAGGEILPHLQQTVTVIEKSMALFQYVAGDPDLGAVEWGAIVGIAVKVIPIKGVLGNPLESYRSWDHLRHYLSRSDRERSFARHILAIVATVKDFPKTVATALELLRSLKARFEGNDPTIDPEIYGTRLKQRPMAVTRVYGKVVFK